MTAACRSSRGRRERDSGLPSQVFRTLFGVWLVLRSCLLEGGEGGAGGVDCDQLRKTLQRHLQTPRIGDLWHQADVGERDVDAERIRPRLDHRLERVKAGENPMVIPGINLRLVLTEFVFQIA